MKNKKRVGYLGSFTERMFPDGERAELIPYSDYFHLLEALEKGLIEKALVPIESAEDFSNWVFDYFLQNKNILIEAEIISGQTRFIVIGEEKKERTGHDKTSIVLSIENRPGALWRVLGIFAHFQINLTMITSRPSRNRLGEYLFFIDIEGHKEDENLKMALEEIGEKVEFLRILGSYPKTKGI